MLWLLSTEQVYCETAVPAMSEMGQKRRFAEVALTSALPPSAVEGQTFRYRRDGPS
jgi:hypothetical protein